MSHAGTLYGACLQVTPVTNCKGVCRVTASCRVALKVGSLRFCLLERLLMPQQGRSGAVSVIALAEKGALFDPGPCMYMEKLAVGPSVNPHMVSLMYPIERNLKVRCMSSSPAHLADMLAMRILLGHQCLAYKPMSPIASCCGALRAALDCPHIVQQ